MRATAHAMKPEHALAIGVFDYLAAVTFGVAAALAASFLVPGSFPMALAMFAGMAVGVVAVFPLFALFGFLLGGFEIIVMSMQIGMLAGMVGVLVEGAGLGRVALAGAITGFVVYFVLDMLNRALRGEVIPRD